MKITNSDWTDEENEAENARIAASIENVRVDAIYRANPSPENQAACQAAHAAWHVADRARSNALFGQGRRGWTPEERG